MPVEWPAEPSAGSEPNGWFAGPHTDPDRFELLGPGLAGGEGNTWQARYRGELTAPLTVAVKELRRPAPSRAEAEELPWPGPADLRRWEDQRTLLQYMRIDHLVTMIDIFIGPPPHLPGPSRRTAPDTPYVVMEWVPGPTLADEFSGEPARPTTLDERLTHVQHVAEALHSLHSRTVSAGNPSLHRDVKPTNCILDPRRGVVLVDVGTMRRVDDGYDDAGLHTPAYTAPEVLANPRAPRATSSDLYSLGALAYFCLLGEDPPVPRSRSAAGTDAEADGETRSDDEIEPDAETRTDGGTRSHHGTGFDGGTGVDGGPRPTRPGELMAARLLAAARAAKVAEPQAFVDHLRQMLSADPDDRPDDAMAWARRLRTLGAVRGRWRPSGVQVSLAAGATLVAVIAVLALVTIRAGGPRAVADALRLTSATPSTQASGGGLQPGPPPGSGPSPGTGPPPGSQQLAAGSAPGGQAAAGQVAGGPAAGEQAPGGPGGPFGPGGPGGPNGPPPGAAAAVSGLPQLGAQPGVDGTIRTDVAAILQPVNGGQVARCLTVSGTSKLPAGHTLLLAVENLDSGDGVRHLRTVVGWQKPATLRSWHGEHFIGLPGDPAGGHYRIEVLMAPLDTLQKQITTAWRAGSRWDTVVPAGSYVEASIMVTRSAAPDSTACASQAVAPPAQGIMP